MLFSTTPVYCAVITPARVETRKLDECSMERGMKLMQKQPAHLEAEIKIEGDEFLMMREEDILGIIQ